MSLIELPYGTKPYPLTLGAHHLVQPLATPPPTRPAFSLARAALRLPSHGVLLDEQVQSGDRVVIIVSDDTRNDPRDEMIRALRQRLPQVRLTIAVATGTHGPCDVSRLDLGDVDGIELVNHDCDDDANLVVIGHSRRGTPFRVNRCVAEADWVIATGCVRPHYFAGFGGGCKAIFPGLGGRAEIRQNHELKSEPGAQAGEVVDNPCRRDMEEVLEHLPGRAFLLNMVVDCEDRAHMAVAGDVVAAFRHAAQLARPFHQAVAPTSRLIIASAKLPISGSLYQASKIVAAVARILEDDGVLVLVAECAEGVGGVEVVNQAIYEIGLRPRLPDRHTIYLVSDLAEPEVSQTYCEYAASIDEVIARHPKLKPTVIPDAAELLLSPL